jgi:putative ABC transport system permease protein
MFKNYFKVALRNILRYKGLSFINIFGLAFGMACCLLLILWIQDEISYDRFHENANRIYRIETAYVREGKDSQDVRTSAPLAPALLNDFPEIEKSIRFGDNDFWVSCQNKRFLETVFFADPEVFEVFTFPLIKGDPKTALKEPYSLVISEDMSRKYFGKENPVGKNLTLKEWHDFTITGVFKNIPRNSHIHFNFLAPFPTYAGRDQTRWGIYNYHTYLLTAKGFNPQAFQKKLPAFVEKYQGKMIRSGSKFRYLLQPMIRIHLYSHTGGELEQNGDIDNIYVFSAIAVFILLIACFNYINFTTAQYATRTREVGIRKVVGANKQQIIGQFLRESLLLSFLALVLAYILAGLFLPVFSSLSAKELSMNIFSNGWLFMGMVLLVLFVSVLAGSHPAFFLSAVQPAAVIRKLTPSRLKGSLLRNVLVVAQFTISIIFIIGTLIIAHQLSYVRNKNLGIDKEHVISIPIHDETALKRIETIKNELLKNLSILDVSASSFFPGKNNWNQSYWREGISENEYPMIRCIAVDENFLKTYGIKLAAGRNFSLEFPSDVEHAYLLNESAVKEIGWESPVGKQFRVIEKGIVVGVVKDFHFESLHQKIEPLALYLYPSLFEYLSVRVRPENVIQTLDFLKKRWAEFAPSQSFEYSFLDEDFDRLYKSEMRLGKIFSSVTAVSILIACLGLFGLAALTAMGRTKEIGIRKVLGASITGVTLLLSKEFIRWVLAANLIAWPIAYYFMSRWLQNFAYRTSIGIGIFIISGLLALAIALLTVSYQSIKAAIANPVESLRYE